MTKISSTDASRAVSRRTVIKGAVGAGVAAAALQAPEILAQQSQASMPLTGRMRMLEYMPAGDGFRLPNIPFADEAGNSRTLASFLGQPVILTLWRIQCHVCQADMPELSRVRDSSAGRDFHFVPLSFPQDSLAEIRRFHVRKNITNLPIYRMESLDLFNAYAPVHPGAGARATPTTILFDRRGNARLAIVGVRTGLHLQEGQVLLEWLKTA